MNPRRATLLGGGRTRVRAGGGARCGRGLPAGASPGDLELRGGGGGMGWWRGLLRSVWGSLSKEVREHVGTDHLGNKYYFIAEYKNWRGESEKRPRVAARPGQVAVTANLGPGLGCPGPCLSRGARAWSLPWATKSGPSPPRSARGVWGASGKTWRRCPAWSLAPGCPQSLPFPVALGLGRSPCLSPSLKLGTIQTH